MTQIKPLFFPFIHFDIVVLAMLNFSQFAAALVDWNCVGAILKGLHSVVVPSLLGIFVC